MLGVVDKAIVFIGTILVYFRYTYSNENSIIALLAAITIVSFVSYVESKRLKAILISVYSVMVVFYPYLIVGIPIVFYDVYLINNPVPALLCVIALVSVADTFGMMFVICMALLGGLSVLLCNKTYKLNELNMRVKQIRDDGYEKTMLLAEKNRHLLEKQDSEIYVATLKERNRIAREIHDNVGHMLTRTILQMGALMTIYKDEPLHGQLSLVKDNLDVAMNNVRESVHDLHDESIDLKQAIWDIVNTLEDKFKCSYEYDINTDVDRQYKYAIIGVVKEAVSNIIKYSNNDMVDITLREHPAMYQIVIRDYSIDKKELRKTGSQSSGMGIQNMRDRVDALNGNITVDIDGGYRIFVTLPK